METPILHILLIFVNSPHGLLLKNGPISFFETPIHLLNTVSLEKGIKPQTFTYLY